MNSFIKTFRLYFMSALVFCAGILHLVSPELFLPAIPPFLPSPTSIIYFTGIFEIILAMLLLNSKTQDWAAKTLALYLLLLLPVHIYVSYFGIEMFGISNKLLLWMRTLFQFVLYFIALSLQTKSWVIEQAWHDLMFIHYKIEPEKIKHLVPYELDLYDGKAVLSVVPFYMDGIRFPFLPSIPKLSSLWELNIRTYVTVNGVRGIYFFTLETDSKISEIIAKNFFHLPYRFSAIKANVTNDHYLFEHHRKDLTFSLKATIGKKYQMSSFDVWAIERYSLFTEKNGVTYQGVVEHRPWDLQYVFEFDIDNNFTKMVTCEIGDIIGISYAKKMKVRFQNFKKCHT